MDTERKEKWCCIWERCVSGFTLRSAEAAAEKKAVVNSPGCGIWLRERTNAQNWIEQRPEYYKNKTPHTHSCVWAFGIPLAVLRGLEMTWGKDDGWGVNNKNQNKSLGKRGRKEKEREQTEDEIDGEKVQHNCPGTFQSWYVKPAHCVAVDNMTAYTHAHPCAHTHTHTQNLTVRLSQQAMHVRGKFTC